MRKRCADCGCVVNDKNSKYDTILSTRFCDDCFGVLVLRRAVKDKDTLKRDDAMRKMKRQRALEAEKTASLTN
jgi:hypothetical protein